MKHHVTINLIESDGDIIGVFRSHYKQSLIRKFIKMGFYPPKSRGEYFLEIDEIWLNEEMFKKIKKMFFLKA